MATNYRMQMFLGQAGQDKFIVNVLKGKKNGFFLEIGSNEPKHINNSYILEMDYDWKGIMVEYNPEFLPRYKIERPNSIPIINDARLIDYKSAFETNNMPTNMDYLQIDLDVDNQSTIQTLEKVNSDLLDTYKFAAITFEHDIYRGNYYDTRARSRSILENRGYLRVFSDVGGPHPFEDWYVHPDLVDMSYINSLIELNAKNYIDNNITGKSLSFNTIQYL